MPPCSTFSSMLRIKGKVEQSREWSSALPYTSAPFPTPSLHLLKREPSGHLRLSSVTLLANFQNNGKIWISCVDKTLFSDGKNIVQAKQLLGTYNLDSAPSETTIKMGYAGFKRSRTDTNNAERSGCPNSILVPENTKNLHKRVLADRKLNLRKIAEKLWIWEGSAFTILHEYLSMRKLCSKSVPRLLIVDQKHQRVDDSDHCLQLFQRKRRSFCVL